MAVDPLITAALAEAARVARGNARLPVATDARFGSVPNGVPATTGAQIPPFVRNIAAALLSVAEATQAAGFISVQQDLNAPVIDINQVRFTGGAIVTDLGDNIVGVEVAGPIDPGQVLTAARVGTTADLGGVYTVDAGGPFLDQISVAAVPVIDGIGAFTVGERILVKDQAAPAENGVYEVIQVGPPFILQRTADYNGLQDPGKIIQVLVGATNADLIFQQTSPDTDPVTVGGAAGDALVFSQYPFSTGATRLQETVGATGTYASIDAAITAFAAGTWGDGVNFRIVIVDTAAHTTGWAALPAGIETVQITSGASSSGPDVTVTAPCPASMYVAGDVDIIVDAAVTHLCERAAGDIYLVLRDSARVTTTLNLGGYDLVRAAGSRFLCLDCNATAVGCRFFGATLAGAAAATSAVLVNSVLGGDVNTAGSGSGAAVTTLRAVGSDVQGTLLDLGGTMTGCRIFMNNVSAGDALSLNGDFTGLDATITRVAGGTAFTFDLTNAKLYNCDLDFNDSGTSVAGTGTMISTAAVLTEIVDTQLPGSTTLAPMNWSGPFECLRMTNVVVRASSGVNDVDIEATERIEGLALNIVTGDLTLDSLILRDIGNTVIGGTDGGTFFDGAGGTYNIGTSPLSLVENVKLNFGDLGLSATAYTLGIRGQTIRNVQIINPDPGALAHSIGVPAVTGPEANIIENFYLQGDRGGLVPLDMTAVNILGVSAQQLAAGDSTYDVFFSAMHMQKNTIAGNLTVFFTEVTTDPAVVQQHGVLDSTQVTGTTSTSAGTAVALVHQISNCLFMGAASLDGGGGTNDLHLSNTRFVAAPTIGSGGGGGYARAVVSTSISDVATVVTAVAKAIGTGVIGIT